MGCDRVRRNERWKKKKNKIKLKKALASPYRRRYDGYCCLEMKKKKKKKKEKKEKKKKKENAVRLYNTLPFFLSTVNRSDEKERKKTKRTQPSVFCLLQNFYTV